jgi:formylglycine-generating enzyme required for sulfatase activity
MFQMGDEVGDLKIEGFTDPSLVHPVNIPAFYLAAYPVTQALWKAVIGADNNPSHFKGENRPVENVSWQDAQAFLKELNALPNIAKCNQQEGKQYRLPTEAQWEYAARGGAAGAKQGYRYAGSNQLKEVAWFDANSHNETKPVGLKFPNQLGCYDMSGNVWEWCEDHWHKDYDGAPKDGSAWLDADAKKNDRRVVRGGSWDNYDGSCRVAFRIRDVATNRYLGTGFRLSRY